MTPRRTAVVAALAFAVVVVAILVARPARPATNGTATSSSAGAATASPAVIASGGTPSPRASVAPSASLGPGVQGLETSGVGPLRGDWVFAIREIYVPDGVRVRVDVLAIPLAEQPAGSVRGPQVVASYLKSAGGVTLPPSEVLPRQFSPDGRRLALNSPMGIVLLELETGNARLLADGQDPVWGSGERIAFIRGDPSAPRTQTTTWIVAASGGAPREHICGAALAWTSDGSACVRGAAGGIILDDPDRPGALATGWGFRFDSFGRGEVPLGVRPQPARTSRADLTVLAVASTDLPAGPAVLAPVRPEDPHEHRIEVLSEYGGGSQTVVTSERGRFTEVRFAEPRWNPRSDQILYRIEGSRRLETRIVDANTKEDLVAKISGVARAAEWTPNGEQIVYLTDPRSPVGPASEVRVVRPVSGRDDRLLMTSGTDGTRFASIAARGYTDAARQAPADPSPTVALPSVGASGQLVSSNVARAGAVPEASTRTATALEALALELYGELAREPGDLVFSPYSIAVALAMTRAGASGETARQMDAVLHADAAGDLDTAMNALDQALARRPGSYPFGQGTVPLELATANQLWGQQGTEFGQEFLDRLAAYYGAGMRIVDYVHARDEARNRINDWVSERTRARIPELIPEGVLDETTRLVLTNAIYLKAKWAHSFSEARPAPFHRLDGTTTQAQVMRRGGYAGYARAAGYQAVQLTYVGGLSMLVIVPDSGSFASFEASLREPGRLRAVTESLVPTYVNLGLPRFEIRRAEKLRAALSRLGMPIAFTEQADFSKMSPRAPMLIQEVVHEGFIAVDEHGTEAAAATAVIGGATGGPSAWVDLTVDRPFVFLIRDDETGAILFMGRVLDPE